VTASDRRLLAAFARFARHPSRTTAAAVPFADRVLLWLTDDIRGTVRRRDLVDRERWRFRVGLDYPWRGMEGSFSALTTIAAGGSYDVSVGPHPHCASPPERPPPQVRRLRRVSAQSRLQGIESCDDWWTVDLFVDPRGRVKAVTMDLWEP
jgi:hypothetical protein